MAELVNIQRWLTSIMVKPGSLAEKVQRADQHYHLDHSAVIRGTDRMSPQQKIGIYARGYIARLLECMSAEFPAVKYLMGEDLFETFAKAYLIRAPSTSPDLYDLGKHFPAFLKASQPKNKVVGNQTFDLPVDLATLERAIAEAARIPGLESQIPDTSSEPDIFHLFGDAGIHPSPCMLLLYLQYPLIDFVRAVQHDEQPDAPPPAESYVVVSRKNYIVYTHTLLPWQWFFLKGLQSTGSYRKAVEDAARSSGESTDSIMADLVLWLPIAENFGYVYRAL
ncbi:hypothetical protein BEL04_05325 [Mucilaginibacter sp. PPCGB 2223]|uniref:HvfC/BufC N-terminal domain-containing protein n=1 Tax=Mucilaginibacter sp. PPCGB 2223 TaxID=1886027 RepID=UPI0008266C16|nr:DNA-binding domain-containing protein [Mucilaginibacter sp. PPCGB 2223]OCX53716.1 hypothetical protein BEL04_05325 [Mucilaginibacter sp. PPCGB 2223]